MLCRDQPHRPGWSLIELLVVLALLGLLAGFLLPAVLHARQQNDRRLCENNLKQLGLSIHNVNDVYKKLPPVVSVCDGRYVIADAMPGAPAPSTTECAATASR